MKTRYLKFMGILIFMVLLSALLLRPAETKAGVFDASGEVTYKEYWVPHTQFTGGCADHEKPYGSWYLEPYGCEKTVSFQIPDDFSQALKAEIYLDLWRNHESKLARFSVNNGELHAPNVGAPWSRTPYLGPIKLSDLKTGTNQILFQKGGYHLHDIAIRIYYDDAHPLIAGSGSDVTPPDGELLTIQGDGSALAAGGGGNLQVDSNQLTLKANVSNGAKYVEFHSFYFGMDEDTDGRFRDWHNRGRNNWFPGGQGAKPTGGAIDHPGTVATPGDGEYAVDWDVSTVPDQDGVKFKIRVVDDAGNVREAAGGVSNQFSLSRNKSVIGFWQPGFEDAGLWMEGTKPPSAKRNFYMPANFDAADYESAKIMHSYWHGAIVNLNAASTKIWPSYIDDDMWQMSITGFSPSLLWPGLNKVEYSYNNPGENRPGAFVEKPGPFFVLRRASWAIDSKPPSLYNLIPAKNATNVGAGTVIQAQLMDDQSGLDYSTIKMKIQGEEVAPFMEGAKHTVILSYRPSTPFEPNETVEVVIEVCDLDGNCLTNTTYFDVEGESIPTDIVSDDFNSCSLDDTVWEFRDPVGNTSYNVNGAAIEISLPAGSNHDLWQNANDAPRLMQSANNGDFRISARFNSPVDQKYQMQGFLIAKDAQNFLRFSMRYDGIKAYLEAYIFENGVPFTRLNLPLDESLPYVVPTNLAVERFGNTWRYLYLDESETWVEAQRFDYAFEVTEVGFFAGNKGVPASTAPAFTSSVDFFFDDSNPIDPQDQDPLFLPVEVVGAGTVEKTPLCGNPVKLTADPADGYFFKGWSSLSGTIAGRTNPLTTSYELDEVVTATFLLDALTLDVDVVNDGAGEGGSVTITPQKAIYNFGDQVVLTTNAPTGWEFMGWSGDVAPGDENKTVLIISMDDNLELTANFAAEAVTLQTDVEGMGSIQVVPDQSGNYHYGDTVRLKAVPDTDWLFDHWEGDVDGPDRANPIDVVLNGDTEITAVFKERPPILYGYLPFITGSPD